MFSVSVEEKGEMKFYATTRDHAFVMGIGNGGPNPVETMLAGLCGCVCHYVRDFLADSRIECESFMVRGDARQTEDRSRLSSIDLFIDLGGVRAEMTTLRSYIEKCKVYNTLKAGCDIRLVLV